MAKKTQCRADIVDRMSEELNYTKADANIVVPDVFEMIKHMLIEGKSVNIRNFGTFKVVKRKSRPMIALGGEEIFIPEHCALKFEACKTMKQIVLGLDPNMLEDCEEE